VSEELGEVIVDQETARASYVSCSLFLSILCFTYSCLLSVLTFM